MPEAEQKVIVANFGRGNYLWPECKQRSTVATFEDEDLRQLFVAGDRKAYIEYCIANKKTFDGKVPTAAVASRWFGTGGTVADTYDDVWVHKEGDVLWWTVSLKEPAIVELRQAQPGTTQSARIYVISKPAQQWSRLSRTGLPLRWSGLHPKAHDFLRTQGTLISLSQENASYALALINGENLTSWHSKPEWKQKQDESARLPVTHFDAEQRAIMRMVNIAFTTVANANGQKVESTAKIKECHFESTDEFTAYVMELLAAQGNCCALSGLGLQFDGEVSDRQLLASLDRVDSSGHYARGNLQVVCQFINRWKSADDNADFKRLIALVQGL